MRRATEKIEEESLFFSSYRCPNGMGMRCCQMRRCIACLSAMTVFASILRAKQNNVGEISQSMFVHGKTSADFVENGMIKVHGVVAEQFGEFINFGFTGAVNGHLGDEDCGFKLG